MDAFDGAINDLRLWPAFSRNGRSLGADLRAEQVRLRVGSAGIEEITLAGGGIEDA
jgi:hypothetical protein